MDSPKFDHQSLANWFLQKKRELPWRENPTPYAVWVSEVMLQQTQVSVVLPYFERWMKRFPTLKDLAEAPLDVVIKQWEGLGYYSRARHLHEGAKRVVEHFGGTVPENEEALKTIKGLGPYTIGALLSFAFHQKAAAVDGNVLRVLARYFLIEKEISATTTVKEIRLLAQNILPDDSPWTISEALIELGALICVKKPRCAECPLQRSCRAFANGKEDTLPLKKKPPPSILLHRTAAVIESTHFILVKKEGGGKVMQDLHEFPYFESAPTGFSPEEMERSIEISFGLKASFLDHLLPIKHSFTKYRVELTPMRFYVKIRKEVTGYQWVRKENLSTLAFSSGHRKLLNSIHIA